MIGENCKSLLFYIINFLFLYSSNNNNQLITDNFIEYFKEQFNFKKIPPELDFDFKYYTTLFSNYIQYLKTPDTKILSFWNKQLKPFIKDNYPLIKNGIFVMNADFEFLIKEIDKYNINNEQTMLKEIKKKINEINKKNENNNSNTNTNTNKIINKQSIDNENSNIKNDIRPHSETIASASTCDSELCINNLNKINNTIEKVEKKGDNNIKKNIIEKKNEIKENNNIIQKEQNEMDKNKIINNNNLNIEIINGQKSKSEIIYKEMTPNFIDKDEMASKNIIYQPLQKTKIKLIDINLLLKKIVENDFNKKNYEILYAFIRQSFSFMKKDIFIKKIISCYRHYKKLNLSLNNRFNLIYFLNAYIIEMFLYYKSIPKDKTSLHLLLSFYQEIFTEIIDLNKPTNIKKDDKNELLCSTICLETVKIGINDTKKIIKEYSKNYISKLINRRIILYNDEIEIKRKKDLEFEKEKRMSHLVDKNNIKDIKLDDINNDDGRKTHYCENSLMNNVAYVPKKKGNLKKKGESPQNQKKETSNNIDNSNNNNINNINNNEKMRNNSLKSNNSINININNSEKVRNNSLKNSNKRNEKYEFEDITNDDLINIIGHNYEDIIKNKLIIKEEEKYLLNIKNIFTLLNTKKYDEAEILNIKNYDIFYENFPFYKGKDKDKDKDITKRKSGKKMLIRNPTQAIFMKSMTLDVRDLKINITKSVPKRCFSVLDWEPSQIGEKLIKLSYNLLNKIEYKELYEAIFTKQSKEVNSPNIMENIKKFNSLILFIIEDILSYDYPSDRARMIEKWVLIAQYCKYRKDESDCFAIKSALSHYIITGLNLTLNQINSRTRKIMNEIDEYCNLEGNYKTFRDEIKNIKKKEFFVPYLGIILRDLTFFEESGKYLVQGNMINFEKIEKVQNSIDNFFKFKNSNNLINKEFNEDLNFFENLETKSEEELEKIAYQLEPVFKLAKIQKREKRLTQIDNKYFFNAFKRGSCLLNTKTLILK